MYSQALFLETPPLWSLLFWLVRIQDANIFGRHIIGVDLVTLLPLNVDIIGNCQLTSQTNNIFFSLCIRGEANTVDREYNWVTWRHQTINWTNID